MSALTWEDGGRRLATCPKCRQAARVDMHGDRLAVRCFGGCSEAVVLDALDVRSIAAELGALKRRDGIAPGEPPAGRHAEPVTVPLPPLGELLEAVTGFLSRFVVLPGEAEEIAVALFVAHTWAFDGAHATPYLLVVSPEKRSGKSRLLEVLTVLVARPWQISGASEAAMFRRISQTRPTLLLDELDAVFGAAKERTEPLRQILNAGNRPGAAVARCVERGDGVEDFSVYCPKVLAGIDTGARIPDTIRDRSITVHMHRKPAGQKAERFRHRSAEQEAQPLREALEGWAAEAAGTLHEADPGAPTELDDRAAEAWEPLFAIADLAGVEWSQRARAASVSLRGDGDVDAATLGSLLLAVAHEAMGTDETITTGELLTAANSNDELPFGSFNERGGLDARGLASLLRPYGVRPHNVRPATGGQAKGYARSDFAPVWDRYLAQPSHPSQRPKADSRAETEAPPERDGTDGTLGTDIASVRPPVPAPGPPNLTETCACRTPAASPRANGPDLCQNCKKPIAPAAAVNGIAA